MRIALTTWGFPTPYSKSMNGVAASTATIASNLARLGHSVVVITSDADGMPPSYVTEDGVEVHQARPSNWHWYLSKLPKVYPGLLHYLKQWEIGHAAANKFLALDRIGPFDIVEVGPATPWVNPGFRKRPSTKCVIFAHGVTGLVFRFHKYQPSRLERLWSHAERRSAQVADGILSPSRFVADFYRDVYGQMPVILPYPVHIPEQSSHAETDIRIITLGGTGNAKGGDLVIQAMPCILKEHPQVYLSVMSAEGQPEFDQLKKEFPGRVSLLPWLPWDKLQNEFLSHSIFISPSRFETLGLTVAEAMAAGLTVVVSDLPSHREIVNDGETGLTFTTGDAANLADVVRHIVRDSQLRNKLGTQARTWVRASLDPIVLTKRRIDYYQFLSRAA